MKIWQSVTVLEEGTYIHFHKHHGRVLMTWTGPKGRGSTSFALSELGPQIFDQLPIYISISDRDQILDAVSILE